MAEIKISENLRQEIVDFKQCGIELSEGHISIDSVDNSALQVAIAYQQQQSQLEELIRLYQNLIAKDAVDLFATIETVIAADNANALK